MHRLLPRGAATNSRRLTAHTTLRALIVLAALVIFAACTEVGLPVASSAPVDSAAGELRFRMAGPGGAAMVVPVAINGEEPVDLILDTGATITCLDSALVARLRLPEQRLVVGTAVAIGGAGRVRMHRIDSLRVGAAKVRRLTACSMNLAALRAVGDDVHGLLGLNVLRNFHVAIDFERSVLRLTQANR